MKRFAILLCLSFLMIFFASYAENSAENSFNQQLNEQNIKIAKLEAAHESYSDNIAIILAYITIIIALIATIASVFTIKYNKNIIKKLEDDFKNFKEDNKYFSEETIWHLSDFDYNEAHRYLKNDDKQNYFVYMSLSIYNGVQYIEMIKKSEPSKYILFWVDIINKYIKEFADIFEDSRNNLETIFVDEALRYAIYENINSIIMFKSDFFHSKISELESIGKEIKKMNNN